MKTEKRLKKIDEEKKRESMTELIHIPQLDVGLVFAVEHIGHMTSFLLVTLLVLPQAEPRDRNRATRAAAA
jgi:hypothetical protein